MIQSHHVKSRDVSLNLKPGKTEKDGSRLSYAVYISGIYRTSWAPLRHQTLHHDVINPCTLHHDVIRSDIIYDIIRSDIINDVIGNDIINLVLMYSLVSMLSIVFVYNLVLVFWSPYIIKHCTMT